MDPSKSSNHQPNIGTSSIPTSKSAKSEKKGTQQQIPLPRTPSVETTEKSMPKGSKTPAGTIIEKVDVSQGTVVTNRLETKFSSGVSQEYPAEGMSAVSQNEAEFLLSLIGQGVFLFRPSSQPNNITLSRMTLDGKIVHSRLEKSEGKYRFLEKEVPEGINNSPRPLSQFINFFQQGGINPQPQIFLQVYKVAYKETDITDNLHQMNDRESSFKLLMSKPPGSFLLRSEGKFIMAEYKNKDGVIESKVFGKVKEDPPLYVCKHPDGRTTACNSLEGIKEYMMKELEVSRFIRPPREPALKTLLNIPDSISLPNMWKALNTFNEDINEFDPSHWQEPNISKSSLFENISSPEPTRLGPSIHANWLADDRSFAGIMYPTIESRDQVLESFQKNGITRHAHLANDFVVFLQNSTSVPPFPLSSESFKSMQQAGTKTIMTELGPVTVTCGNISVDKSNNRMGHFTIQGMVNKRMVTREIDWPLDSIQLNENLRMELQPGQDPNTYTYVYKNEKDEKVHTLEVGKMTWQDFGKTSIANLHEIASWLQGANCRSAGCRAGVGRTGSLFVAAKMLEWVNQHPSQRLTKKEVLSFIAEGRFNRDPQVVQTKDQLDMLIQYMHYLNANPDLPLSESVDRVFKSPEAQKGSKHIMGQRLGEIMTPDIVQALKDPNKPLSRQDEATLDKFADVMTCPITQLPISDPVIVKGHTFERAAITEWINRKGHLATSPVSREPITLNDIQEDHFIQNVQSMIAKRASASAPKTEVGIVMANALNQIVVHEPLKWCRILSAVMPKNKYFVRMKGLGGTNDYVVEIRGDKGVIKAGFRINKEGRLELTGQKEKRYENIEALVKEISQGKVTQIPTRLTENELSELDQSLGKQAAMDTMVHDANLMNIVKHLELRFDDNTVKPEYKRGGYVRAGISPSSFPCLTYLRNFLDENGVNNIRKRVCLNNGKLCQVSSCELPPVSLQGNPKIDEIVKSLEKKIDEKVTNNELNKEYKKELNKIKNELDFSKPINLFVRTSTPFENLTLANPHEEDVRHNAVHAYIAEIAI